jgi:hypothetical protein
MCRSISEGGRRCSGRAAAARPAQAAAAVDVLDRPASTEGRPANAPTMVELFIMRDGQGVVRHVNILGFSLTPELRAWKDELQAQVEAGTFDKSSIPEDKWGTWVFVRDN